MCIQFVVSMQHVANFACALWSLVSHMHATTFQHTKDSIHMIILMLQYDTEQSSAT